MSSRAPLSLGLIFLAAASWGCKPGTSYVPCTEPTCPNHCDALNPCPEEYSCRGGTCFGELPTQGGSTTGGDLDGDSGGSSGFPGANSTGGSTGERACAAPPPCFCDPGCVADVFGTQGGSSTGSSTTGGPVREGQGGQRTPLPAPDVNAAVYQDPNTGFVTLPPLQNANALIGEFAWIANSIEGTVSQVDTRLGVETARFASVWIDARLHDAGWLTRHPTALHGADPNQAPDYTSECNLPSRTAVDPSGTAAYVANRADADDAWTDPSKCYTALAAGNPPANWDAGSVTKVGRYDDALCNGLRNPTLVGCPCQDRNGDGFITTSRDVDGDGVISVATRCSGSACSVPCNSHTDCLDPNRTGSSRWCFAGRCSSAPQEFWANDDECLVWTSLMPRPAGSTPADRRGPKMRGMGIDPNGWLWAGDSRSTFGVNQGGVNGFLFKINPYNGALLNPNVLLRAYRDDGGPNMANNPAASLAAAAVVNNPTAQSAGVNLGQWSVSHGAPEMILYGAVASPPGPGLPLGAIFSVDRNGTLARVNAINGAIIDDGHWLDANATWRGYGITLDGQGRTWVPVWGSDNSVMTIPRVRVFDPARRSWSIFPSSIGGSTGALDANWLQPAFYGSSVWAGRGATTTLASDGNAYVWAVYNAIGDSSQYPNRADSWLVEFSAATGAIVDVVRTDQYTDTTGAVHPIPCGGPIGVGIGASSTVWVVSQRDNAVCGFDPASRTWQVVHVGRGPYTYSDFTGNIYRNFTQGAPNYTLTFRGCITPDYSVLGWTALQLRADAQGDPNDSSVSSNIVVEARTATTPGGLAGATYGPVGVFSRATTSPASFSLGGLAPNPYMQLRFTLNRAAHAPQYLPTIEGVSVSRRCIFSGGG